MVDTKGNTLQIGDKVAFVRGKNSDASIDIGTVQKFYKGQFNREECTVDGHSHIGSNRVLKL